MKNKEIKTLYKLDDEEKEIISEKCVKSNSINNSSEIMDVVKIFSITDANMTISPDIFTYDSKEKQPKVTIKYGNTTLTSDDYSVIYNSNINVGTGTVIVKGKGNYTDTLKKTFTINPKSISSAELAIHPAVFTYDRTAKNPKVIVKDGGITLTSSDYSVDYVSNIDIGTGTVIVNGKNNYTGTITKTFKIEKKPQKFPFMILAVAILVTAISGGIIFAVGNSNKNNEYIQLSKTSTESQKSDIISVSSKSVPEKSQNSVKATSSYSSVDSLNMSNVDLENSQESSYNENEHQETHQPSIEISEPPVIAEQSVSTSIQQSSKDISVYQSSKESSRSRPFKSGDVVSLISQPSFEPSSIPEPTSVSETVSEPSNVLIMITSTDGLDYTFNTDNNTLTITGEGDMAGSLGNFEENTDTKIETVIIGSKVTSICDNKFESCENLQTIEMEGNVISIGSSAFLNCKALHEIHLSDSLEYLGDGAFCGCMSLKEIAIPQQVTAIYNDTFKDCTELKKVHLSENIDEIDDKAFTGCDKDILTIYAPKGSYAETYAETHKIKFVAEGTVIEDNSSSDTSVV